MAGSNAAQAAEWNGSAAEGWLTHAEVIEQLVAPITEALLEALAPSAGERILDVGCGAGMTTISIAERVAPDGEAVGVDLSEPLLDEARRRSAGRPAPARFLHADAQTATLPGPFDAAFSRMGVMFFEDPAAAFSNITGALRPGGRLVFACWQGPQHNPWVLVPLMAAAAHLPVPPPPPPDSPGPFSLADRGRIEALLSGAGSSDVLVEPLQVEAALPPAGRYADVILSIVPPLAEAMAAADAATRAAARDAVAGALASHGDADGVRLPAAAWLVTARRA